MKKLVSALLCLIMVLSLTACSKKADESKPVSEKTPSESTEIKHTGKKPTEGISRITNFHDGIAFATSKEDDFTQYAINQEGYIIFSLSHHIVNSFIKKDELILLENNELIDMTGKTISPQDKDCKEFYYHAFAEGYIIARKTKTEISPEGQQTTVTLAGIMDTKFNWIVKPNAELEETIYQDHRLQLYDNNSYVVNDILVLESPYNEITNIINLKTGAVNKDEKPDIDQVKSEGLFYATFDRETNSIQSNGKTVAKVDYIKGSVWHWHTTKDYMILTVENSDGQFHAFGMNAKGEKLFEPIPIGNKNAVVMVNDEFFAIQLLDESQKFIKTYDWNGTLLGTTEYISASITISETSLAITEYNESDGTSTLHLYTKDLKLIL